MIGKKATKKTTKRDSDMEENPQENQEDQTQEIENLKQQLQQAERTINQLSTREALRDDGEYRYQTLALLSEIKSELSEIKELNNQ